MHGISHIKISCNLFGIMLAVDSNNSIMYTGCSCRVFISSSFKPANVWSFSVMCCEGCDCWELLRLLNVLVTRFFVKCTYVRSIVMTSLISCYKPGFLQFVIGVF
jgi:hypothetical protein